MALDLTLCLVPQQIEALFLKAANNANYAEWIQFIPALLNGSQIPDYQDIDLVQLKRDVAALKGLYQFTNDHYFYDTHRCFSTIDYLLDEHIRATNSSIQPALLWEGGTKYPGVIAEQGIVAKLYEKAAIEKMFLSLVNLTFSDLLGYYNYEKMLEAGIYKLTPLENVSALELAFWEIQNIFLLAQTEGLLVFKVID